jgi:Na+-translocating ferredoxin:NAD+ oxidoreductase RnfE subunit
MSDVKVGQLKVSRPALITMIAGLIAGISLSRHSFAVGLGITAVFFVYAYNVNCAIHGNCKVFAYFLSIMYLLLSLGMLSSGKSFLNKYGKK